VTKQIRDPLILAPSNFKETHSDFAKISNVYTIVWAWVWGVLLTLTIGSLSYLAGLTALGVIVGFVFIGFAIAITYSAAENKEVYRYYTYVYRTTKPVKADLQVNKVYVGDYTYWTADVYLQGKDVSRNAIIVTGGCDQAALVEKCADVDLYLLPESGQPLVADLGDRRIWMEPSTVGAKPI